MFRARLAWCHAAIGLLALAGCAQSPYSTAGQTNDQQKQTQIAQQNKSLEDQKKALDRSNQDLELELAHSRRQTLLMNDRVAAMKEQLGTVNTQLAQARDERQGLEKKLQQVAANNPSAGSGGTPAIPAKRNVFANSSLTGKLPDFQAAGIPVRTDGDLIRIELPADQLFDPNDSRLRTSSLDLITNIAIEIERNYPQHYMGIEGHSDNEPAVQGVASVHQLTTNRAYAVFEYLTLRSRLQAKQLSVVGYGPNHPIASNGTAAGRAKNRRVELVIYPERVGER